jgi:hypothetical protein
LPEFAQPPFSRIDPVKKFARTVRAYRELVLNYFRAKKQFPSGIVEMPEQQSQSDTEKNVRLSDVQDPRALSVSRTRQASRAKTRPQILLPKHHSRINEHQRVRERKYLQFCGLGQCEMTRG